MLAALCYEFGIILPDNYYIILIIISGLLGFHHSSTYFYSFILPLINWSACSFENEEHDEEKIEVE